MLFRTRFLLTTLPALLCSFPALGSADPPAFRVVRKGIVYEAEVDSAQPGIVRAPDGSLLATFYSGPNILTSRSTDEGTTWQKANIIVEGASTELAVVRLKNGTILWPFYQEFVKEPCCQVRRYSTYVYRSGDSGKTWQGDEPIQVPMREPIPYGRILELSDGRLLMPVWGAWELGGRWQMGTFESTDAGHTWANYIQIGYDPKAGCRPDNGFTETSLAQISAQTLVAILRQQRVGTSGGPCDVYTEPAEHFYRAVSHDLGKTWSAPQMLPLIGTSPALFVTRSGTLVLGNRDHPQQGTDTEHYGLSVRVSHDQGATWTNEVHLQDPKGLQYSRYNQPGYPDFADLPDGKILVVFHSVKVAGQPQRRGKPGEGALRKRVLYVAYNVLQPEP
jgi:hypothetical protein